MARVRRHFGARALAVFFVVLAALAPRVAAAQTLPALTEPVNDFAHVVDQASAKEMDRRIRVLQSVTKDVVVVATVDTFAPYATIEEYATRLFEQAKIGQRETDNGVLIVVAVKERRVRIEVGYGLEEFITDGFSGDTIRQAMLPEFRENRYGSGLLAGTTRLIQRIAEKRGVTLPDVPQDNTEDTGGGGFNAVGVLVGLIVVFAILNSFRRRGGGPRIGPRVWGPWSGWPGGLGGFGGGFGGGGFGGFGGGGGGGGFGGFGGGLSGGGGASGRW